jgi:predicted ATP-grasp superfamily ATP-dependent carboligase
MRGENMDNAARSRSRPGAVVIGGDYQGLGIARSLGRLGVDVHVVDDERSISAVSRYVRRSLRVPSLRDEQEIVDTLLELASSHELAGAVLYPTRDEVVEAIARRRDDLLPVFRVPTPPWETVRWVADKRRTYELARSLGIPTPETSWPGDESALAAHDHRLPVVVKPARKGEFLRQTGAKAWRADTPEELRDLYGRAAGIVPGGEVMLQELVPGGGEHQYAYCAFWKDGRPVASMHARRRRQHPWQFGRASTYVETVDEPELDTHSEKLLRAIDYYGLVEIEYKRDPRSGELALLDVNARTWGYHTLGAAAGIDFAALLYRDQIGETVTGGRGRAGVRWLRLLTDLPTGAVDVAAGRIALRQYLASLRSADVEAVFDRRDLRPGLRELTLIPYLLVRRGF